MTSEALADSSSRATEYLTEKYCFKSACKSTKSATVLCFRVQRVPDRGCTTSESAVGEMCSRSRSVK